MSYDAKSLWYPKFKELQLALKKPKNIEEIKSLILYLHSQLHSYDVHGLKDKTYYDEIITYVNYDNFNICPTVKNMTIAWDLWHITRIEDLTTSILLCKNKQVFDEFSNSLGTTVTDTGNDMTDKEIFELGEELALDKILLYRKTVGKKTKEFIKSLSIKDLKRKFSENDIQRIKKENGVIPTTEWLIDYWGNKTVSGIITMPMTKHQIIHLNDCLDIIIKYNKKLKRSK